MKLKFTFACVALSFILLNSCRNRIAGEKLKLDSKISIDANFPTGKVNRRILGQNILGYVYEKNNFARDTNISMRGAGLWNPQEKSPVPAMIKFLKATGTSVMRWPGGCGAHEFNWKKTVGPLGQRPMQAFGLPEFLKCCEDIGADPIITLADFWGAPEDFADLAEYLNSPLGLNPNGGKDWAEIRKKDGHSKPYGIIFFECGNETYHGNHKGRFYTPKEYADRFRAIRQAMKSVDPSIKLGAVLDNGYLLEPNDWTRDVVKHTGDVADFYIQHSYLPKCGKDDNQLPAKKLFSLAFACARQFEAHYSMLNEFILKKTGRKIPLAITEINTGFHQSSPVPYRFSLGAAVQVADLMQVLMKPELKIDNVAYWQFANEFWGMIRGYNPAYINQSYWKSAKSYWDIEPYRPAYLKQPAYYTYKLYHKYLGEEFLKLDINCPTYQTDGRYGVLPAFGDPRKGFELIGKKTQVKPDWKFKETDGAFCEIEKDGTLFVDIKSKEKINFFHAEINLSAKPLTSYCVTAEIRAEDISPANKGARIDLGDGRGFDLTKSQAASNVAKSNKWTKVKCVYTTLSDADSINVIARRLRGAPCKFWVRNIEIQECITSNTGAIPYLAGIAMRRKDGNTSAIIINRNIDNPIPVMINGLRPKRVHAETLSGPSVDATNEKAPDTCILKKLETKIRGSSIVLLLPPHSVTGLIAEQ